jgi:hypothetical protein
MPSLPSTARPPVRAGDGPGTGEQSGRPYGQITHDPDWQRDSLRLPHTVFYIIHTLRKRALVDRKGSSRDGIWRRRYFVIDDKRILALVDGSVQYDLHTCLSIYMI